MFVEVAHIAWWENGIVTTGVFGTPKEIQGILQSLDKRLPNNKYFIRYTEIRVGEHKPTSKREKVAA